MPRWWERIRDPEAEPLRPHYDLVPDEEIEDEYDAADDEGDTDSISEARKKVEESDSSTQEGA